MGTDPAVICFSVFIAVCYQIVTSRYYISTAPHTGEKVEGSMEVSVFKILSVEAFNKAWDTVLDMMQSALIG